MHRVSGNEMFMLQDVGENKGQGERKNHEFSFSGLKTAVRNALLGSTNKGGTHGVASHAAPQVADLAASFQEAVVDVLVRKTVAAARDVGVSRVFLAGGVAANERLRERMSAACTDAGLTLFYPPPVLCTDNGAMIAATGYFYRQSGRGSDDLSLAATPSAPLESVAA